MPTCVSKDRSYYHDIMNGLSNLDQTGNNRWPLRTTSLQSEDQRSRSLAGRSEGTHVDAGRRSPSYSFALAVKPRPHQQQCRSNVRLCRSNISFDFLAQNGNNVERVCHKISCFRQVEHVQFVDIVAKKTVTLSNVASTLLLVWTGLKSTFDLLLLCHSKQVRSWVRNCVFIDDVCHLKPP